MLKGDQFSLLSFAHRCWFGGVALEPGFTAFRLRL